MLTGSIRLISWAFQLVSFSGRMRKRTLKPGVYRVSVRVRDITKHRSKPRSATFRVT